MCENKSIFAGEDFREYITRLPYEGNVIITEVNRLRCSSLAQIFFLNYLSVLYSFNKVIPTQRYYAWTNTASVNCLLKPDLIKMKTEHQRRT